jgi:hypothetical protein
MKATNRKWMTGAVQIMGIAALLSIFLAPLRAQSSPDYAGKFTFAHDTQWGDTMIPAGTYTLTMESAGRLLYVRNAQTGKNVAVELGRSGMGPVAEGSEIRVAVRGNQQAVTAVEIARFGEVYSKMHPFAKSQRQAEEEATIHTETIEVAQN